MDSPFYSLALTRSVDLFSHSSLALKADACLWSPPATLLLAQSLLKKLDTGL